MIRWMIEAMLDIMGAILVLTGDTVERAVEDERDWWIGGTDADDDPHPERVRDL